MKRLIAVACTLITVLGVWVFTPKREAMAHPAAGQATDCAPNVISPANTPNGFFGLQKFGPFNGSYAFNVSAKYTWTCPPPAAPYATTCAPCYKVSLHRDMAYQPSVGDLTVTPQWQDMHKPESYFQINNQPSGACGLGGVHTFNFTCNQLAAGRYTIYLELGAGDDRRCYTLLSAGEVIVIP